MRDEFPKSEANFSLFEENFVSGDGPDPDVPEYDRLVIERVIGSGGMGRVLLARDLRLNRRVAVKEVIPSREGEGPRSRTSLEARLAREAWITSLLEHPGILPIYDIGTRPDGTLYYTMPLVEGESFADAIRRTERAQRMTLLRRFLEACEAVAAAHRRGVIHRDIKPENIMLVEGGGTRVVDWGLACLVSELPAMRSGVLGTPGYMSPEQRQGSPVDKGTDVWSLGATLHELLVGTPWTSKSGLRNGKAIDIELIENIPFELRAILKRALAASPGKRYSDAGAMASDLARFLDGRKVEAHEYSARELMVRFIRASRIPLMVAGAAIVAISVVIMLSLLRLSEERDRAVEAEQNTSEALKAADRGLSRSLASQARLYAEREATPEAEIIAANALLMSESPVARGVLFGSSAKARPTRVYSAEVSKCLDADFDEAREVFACRTDEAIELWKVEPTRLLWRIPKKARSIGVSGNYVYCFNENRFVTWVERESGKVQMEMPTGCGLNILATQSRMINADSSCVWTTMGLEGNPERIRPCHPEAYISAFNTSEDGLRWAAGCSDGYVIVGDFGEELRRDYEVPYSNPHIVMALAFGRRGDLILGTNRGDLRRLDLESGMLGLTMGTGLRQVDSVKVSAKGLVLATSEYGSPVVVDVATQRRLLTLPSGARADIDWMEERLLEIRNGEFNIWSFPTSGLSSLDMEDGVTSVEFDASGERVLVTHADGVGVWRIRDGRTLLDIRKAGVVKGATFSEGEGIIHLASSFETPGVREINLELGADVTSPMEFSRPPGRRRHDGRRILGLKNDWYLTLSYSCGVGLQRAVPELREAPRPCMLGSGNASGPMTREELDSTFSRFIDGSSDGHEVLLLEQTRHAVWWLSPDLLWLERLFEEPGALAISSASDGRTVALAVPLGVVVRDAFTGDILRFFAVPSAVSDVAISPDARWVVAGSSSGGLWVWDLDGAVLVAQIDAHRERISTLRFSRDGQYLASGAWDGRVRFYDMNVLSSEPEEILREVEGVWGLNLAEIQGQMDVP